MEKELNIKIPQMIMIGSGGRNNGKTTLAKAIIQKFSNTIPIIGLKIISIDETKGKCHRGVHGCGICTNIIGTWELLEETKNNTNKDTSIMLYSGAQKVYLLKVLKEHFKEGITDFLSTIKNFNIYPECLIVCESNTARLHVEPALFLFSKCKTSNLLKPSAKQVINYADMIIEDEGINSLENLIIVKENNNITFQFRNL
jgi:Predicted ATPase of the ABC class